MSTKFRLRSVPRATRVILRKEGELNKADLLSGILERYEVAPERKDKVVTLLERALQNGVSIGSLTSSQSGYNLNLNPSVVTKPTSQTKKQQKRSRKKSPKSNKLQETRAQVQVSEINNQQSQRIGAKWEYFDNGWHPYDQEASDLVEQAYQEYIANPGMYDVRAVKSGTWHYQVDFPNNKQTNIEHQNHTQRDIRRVSI